MLLCFQNGGGHCDVGRSIVGIHYLIRYGYCRLNGQMAK